MDPIEQRVRDSLHARAADVDATPALYQGVQQRIARRQRLRVVSWSLAGVAAIAAAVVIVPNVLSTGDVRPPEVADTPDPVESPEATTAPGDPEHALLALDGGAIVLTELDTGEREELIDAGGDGDGTVTALTAAPGGTADSFRAVAVTEGDAQGAMVTTITWGPEPTVSGTAAVDLPGGTGQPPAVAIAPDGGWLAYTGISQTVDAAPAVYVVPITADGTLGIDDFQEVHTVTTADELDAIDELIEWSGPVAGEGDVSRLRVRGADRQGALVLERTDDGFQVQQRETYGGEVGSAIDVSDAFVASDPSEDPVFLLERGDGGLPTVRLQGTTTSTDDLGADAEEVALDARGRTALLVGDGKALSVRILESGGEASIVYGSTIEGVTAGALLGGFAPEAEEQPEPEEPETSAAADLGDGLVVADDRTVSLIRPDGSSQELVTFPVEGESTVIDVAVRPGSTATDLTVAITTRAEGMFDVRWLRVEGDEVVDDPAGTDFPAPPIEGANGFPLAVPDLQDGRAPAAVWSPEGDLLAAVVRPSEDAPLEVRTIKWTDDGPSDDPNLAATFALDTDRSLTVRSWVWTDDVEGVTREGTLLLVDDLAGGAFTVRLDRQGDGAPAMPASNPLTPVGEGVLDLRDTDGDGTFEAVLRDGPDGPVLEVDGASVELPADAVGPRATGRVTVVGGSVLVVLDPASPLLVDRASGQVQDAPIGGEVVSADAIG